MKTLKLRIKDKHAKQLTALSSSVNFVWNYVNDISFKHLQRTGLFFSAYDLAAYTKGAGSELGLHSQTLQAITETHAKSRKQFKKAKLNWRTNNPKAKRQSLGWIPFKKSAIKHLATRKTGKKVSNQRFSLVLPKVKSSLSMYGIATTLPSIPLILVSWYKTHVAVGTPASLLKTFLGLSAAIAALALIWVARSLPLAVKAINSLSNKPKNGQLN